MATFVLLGAILSPPDAVAATGITKGLGLSHRTLTILEGESLVNDASGLIAYRFAVGAVTGAGFTFLNASGEFLLVVVGGAIVGLIVGWILGAFLRRIYGNSLIAISAMALAPFVAYLIAEELEVSGVLAVVVLGVTLAAYTNRLFPSQIKLQNKSFWDVIIFLLNGFVFILIGLEFPQVVRQIDHDNFLPLIGYSFIISFIMLVFRIFWIFGHSNNLRKKVDLRISNTAKLSARQRLYADEKIDWKNSLIIGWAGMRGIVSLASALALPFTLDDGTLFPQREILIFISVIVVLITLLVQGLTLPLLVKWLKVEEEEAMVAH